MSTPQDLADTILTALNRDHLPVPFTPHDVQAAFRDIGREAPDKGQIMDALEILEENLYVHSPDFLAVEWHRPFMPESQSDMEKLARLQADPDLTEAQKGAISSMVSANSRQWDRAFAGKYTWRQTAEALERRGVLEFINYGDSDPRRSGYYAAGRFGELMRERASLG